jgi:hypothetical protein
VTGGSVVGSGPSSRFGLISGGEDTTAAVAAGVDILGVAIGLEPGVPVGGGWAVGGLAGPPRSRGVYSVVNDGPGRWAAETLNIACVSRKRQPNLSVAWNSRCVARVCLAWREMGYG